MTLMEKPIKPKIDDIVEEFLSGENLNRALEFLTYLRINKINTQWTNTNTWKAVKKGVCACYLKMGIDTIPHSKMQQDLKYNNESTKGSWVIYPHIESIENGGLHVTAENKCIEKRDGYEEIISNDKLFNIILSKTRACLNCGNKKKCAPGISVTFWGRELNNRCQFISTPFVNPNKDELECVIALLNIYCRLHGIGGTDE